MIADYKWIISCHIKSQNGEISVRTVSIVIVAIATVVAIEMVDPIIDITILLSAVELSSWNCMENDGIAPQIMLKNQFTQINCVCN